MIFDILHYIENNLESSPSKKKQPLSVMHLDIHRSDMDRAMAFVFKEGDRYPEYVVKYPKCPEYSGQLLDEFNRYSEIYERLSPDLKRYLSNPICLYHQENDVATIEKGLPGVSVWSLMKKKYNEKQILSYFDESFGFLIKFQNETCMNTDPSEEFLKKNFETPIKLFCNRFSLTSPEKRTLSLVKDKAFDFLIHHKSVSACHGDYWSNNLLIHNHKLFVVDWANCRPVFFKFWDLYSLIYMVPVGNDQIKQQYQKMGDDYLNKIHITHDIDPELRIIYCAIRSVWNEFLFNAIGPWDGKWKKNFDIELSRYVKK